MKTVMTLIVVLLALPARGGEKPLNFLPDPDAYAPGPIPQAYYIECNRGGANDYCERGPSTGVDPDTTPFLKEFLIIDDGISDAPYVDGQYQHMIIGVDPGDGDGFVQETYIRSIYTTDAITITEYAGGDTTDAVLLGNGIDTSFVGLTSGGNATGNPNRILVRQKINDGDMKSDFVKDTFNRKPIISQTITSLHAGVSMLSTFVLDMSNSDYNTDSMAGIMQNDLSFGEGNPGGFTLDLYQNADINIDGGRYIYTQGSGMFGSEGSYNYTGSSLDPTTINWLDYDDGTNW